MSLPVHTRAPYRVRDNHVRQDTDAKNSDQDTGQDIESIAR